MNSHFFKSLNSTEALTVKQATLMGARLNEDNTIYVTFLLPDDINLNDENAYLKFEKISQMPSQDFLYLKKCINLSQAEWLYKDLVDLGYKVVYQDQNSKTYAINTAADFINLKDFRNLYTALRDWPYAQLFKNHKQNKDTLGNPHFAFATFLGSYPTGTLNSLRVQVEIPRTVNEDTINILGLKKESSIFVNNFPNDVYSKECHNRASIEELYHALFFAGFDIHYGNRNIKNFKELIQQPTFKIVQEVFPQTEHNIEENKLIGLKK